MAQARADLGVEKVGEKRVEALESSQLCPVWIRTGWQIDGREGCRENTRAHIQAYLLCSVVALQRQSPLTRARTKQ